MKYEVHYCIGNRINFSQIAEEYDENYQWYGQICNDCGTGDFKHKCPSAWEVVEVKKGVFIFMNEKET